MSPIFSFLANILNINASNWALSWKPSLNAGLSVWSLEALEGDRVKHGVRVVLITHTLHHQGTTAVLPRSFPKFDSKTSAHWSWHRGPVDSNTA